jgi:hypothetical protein
VRHIPRATMNLMKTTTEMLEAAAKAASIVDDMPGAT